MEFDIETDPDTMHELFGEEYECFAECVQTFSLMDLQIHNNYLGVLYGYTSLSERMP